MVQNCCVAPTLVLFRVGMVVWPRAAVLALTCCSAAGRTLGKEKCEKARREVGSTCRMKGLDTDSG